MSNRLPAEYNKGFSDALKTLRFATLLPGVSVEHMRNSIDDVLEEMRSEGDLLDKEDAKIDEFFKLVGRTLEENGAEATIEALSNGTKRNNNGGRLFG